MFNFIHWIRSQSIPESRRGREAREPIDKEHGGTVMPADKPMPLNDELKNEFLEIAYAFEKILDGEDPKKALGISFKCGTKKAEEEKQLWQRRLFTTWRRR